MHSLYQSKMMLSEPLMLEISRIARKAGHRIMEHYAGNRESRAKADRSPVTDADIDASNYILLQLKSFTPEIPALSEENEDFTAFVPTVRYWLIDPLDGTRSYVRGSGAFTVNIGLIENHYPVMGAIYLPLEDMLYYGAAGTGAFCRRGENPPVPIHTRAVPQEGMRVIKSSHHPSRNMDQFLSAFPVHEVTAASSSVKFCLLAEGKADLYPRLSPTMEWDTAAGQAILEAAGGRVETLNGARLSYGKPGSENPSFAAFGR